MEQTNSNIINPFTIRNKSDFESLFRKHYSNLCSYANKYLEDLDASEEVVQEMFYKLWDKRESLNIETSIQSYLFRAVRNASLNVIKHINIREDYKDYRKLEIEEEEQNFDDGVVVSELEEKIRKSIDLLPVERRKVFIMSRFDGLKYKEIAEKQNISIKTVENQMGKALKFLREELSEYISITILLLIDFLSKF